MSSASSCSPGAMEPFRNVSRRDPSLPSARLETRGDARSRVRASYELATGTPYAVGRVAGCCGQVRGEVQEIRLDDATVARFHAMIEPYREGWTVIDKNSSCGIYVNDEHVNERTLRAGDVVRFGALEFVFRENPRDDPSAG